MIHWLVTDWHWALILLALALLAIFGFVAAGVDENGDFWII